MRKSAHISESGWKRDESETVDEDSKQSRLESCRHGNEGQQSQGKRGEQLTTLFEQETYKKIGYYN